MIIDIQSTNFSIKEDLRTAINEKSEKLKKLHDNIISIHYYLKLENNHQKENKVTEIKIHIPGDEFLVKKLHSTFEEGIVEGIEVIMRHLKKVKSKK